MAEPRREPRLEPQKGPSPIQPPSFTWEPRDAGAALSGGRPDQMPVSDRSLLLVVWGVVSLGTGGAGGCSGLGPDSVAGTRVGVGVRVKV